MEEFRHRHLHLLIHFFLLSTLTLVSPAVTSSLFVLGDSTTNCGDNTVLYPLLPPNLTSCFDSRHRLLPNLIAEHMGLPPPPPFCGGNFTSNALTTGINFGSTPATIITGDDSEEGERMFLKQSLSQQVRQVYEVLQLLHLEMGPTEFRRVVTSGVFVLSFGTDDYVDLFTNGGSRAVGLKYGRRGLARVLVSQMVHAVKDLYNVDVRKIALIGVAPLGCAPHIVWEGMNTLQGGDCLEEVNEIISSYNAKLSKRLLDLQTQLPGLQITFCDVYRGIMEIISNPLTYGFKDPRNACCGIGMFGGMIGCFSHEMACSDPSTHVWWDFYGATEAANTLLANWSWSSPDPQHQICSPIALRQLASAS